MTMLTDLLQTGATLEAADEASNHRQARAGRSVWWIMVSSQ